MEEERLITCEKIEQWAEDLLTLCLVAKEGKEHEVWLATYHLFCGLKMFDLMSAEDREKVRDVYDKTKGMFDFKLILKDKKTKKAEIKKNTPAPQDKNKEENKEEKKKTQKKYEESFSTDFETRKEAFWQLCLGFRSSYNDDVLTDFFNWATEPNKTKSKMRFEGQKYWDIEKRLARWAKNHVASDNEAAAIRLNETKKRQSKETKSMEKQQVVAAVRIAADEKREAETAKAKAASVSLEEYLKTHPDSNLKMFKKK